MATRRFRLSGELDLATVTDVQKELEVLISATRDDIVLDCAELEFIDSTGIGMFIYVHSALEVQGRECRIVNLSDRVRLPFQSLGLAEKLNFSELDPA